jgi:dTDP-4-amino-4,6-dideoxygalactose transaminase
MADEIGSDFHLFGLTVSKIDYSAWFNGSGQWTGSGRDAFRVAIEKLGLQSGDEVLLPAYLCEDVVTPFAKIKAVCRFYRCDRHLEADMEDLKRKIGRNTRALVIIHYFGFPQKKIANFIRENQFPIVVIEDVSHALFSQVEGRRAWGEADISVASLRKLLPLPDGGYTAYHRSDDCDSSTAITYRHSLGHGLSVSCRFFAAVLKSIWLRLPILPKRVFRQFFFLGEKFLSAYPKPAAMSTLSRFILRHLDWQAIVLIRRRNYAYLAEGLSGIEGVQLLYPEMPEGVCPLGLPIIVDDRSRLALHLIENKIYTPVHWELPATVDRDEFSDAWYISDRVLTLPIDQRYDLTDMQRIVEALLDYEAAS